MAAPVALHGLSEVDAAARAARGLANTMQLPKQRESRAGRAVRVVRLLAEQLTRLPEDHPDRTFLTGLHTAVAAYREQVPPERVPATVLYDAGGGAAVEGAQSAAPQEATAEAAAPTPEQERNRYFGRVAAKPDFQRLPRGGRRGHFPLATHPSADETVYYDVYTWNKPGKPWTDRLEQLNLQRGQAVEVIGYEHDGGRKKDGTPRPTQIYAGAPIKAQ